MTQIELCYCKHRNYLHKYIFINLKFLSPIVGKLKYNFKSRFVFKNN